MCYVQIYIDFFCNSFSNMTRSHLRRHPIYWGAALMNTSDQLTFLFVCYLLKIGLCFKLQHCILQYPCHACLYELNKYVARVLHKETSHSVTSFSDVRCWIYIKLRCVTWSIRCNLKALSQPPSTLGSGKFGRLQNLFFAWLFMQNCENYLLCNQIQKDGGQTLS
jgi:hypothetical protein